MSSEVRRLRPDVPAHIGAIPTAVSAVTPPRAGVEMTDTHGGLDDSDGPASLAPADFRRAVATMTDAPVRRDVRLEPVRPPQRLAPWSHAVAADVVAAHEGDAAATGRLVLLHDPDGHDAWHGTLRLVAFATAELDEAMSVDPLLPTVGWSWLTDALGDRGAAFTAAGGTVTHTLSTRFGDLAGPAGTASIELRASWTALEPDLGPHLLAFVDVLAAAAGLPPEGVVRLGRP